MVVTRKTGPDKGTVELVFTRSNGLCERCGQQGEQIHHRRPRGQGGTLDKAINKPSNLVHLCLSCHSWVEQNRDSARDAGWLVSRLSIDPPASFPVNFWRGWVLLDDEGGFSWEAN